MRQVEVAIALGLCGLLCLTVCEDDPVDEPGVDGIRLQRLYRTRDVTGC